ncbi:tetratricopeptide repeat protein [Photobacterium sanguinicancri]|uniref:tetratricopeptide repeat protein n=1 Tax=Photobacterium sanguinicancri TaxID=875932 RepID=UPI0007875391|nr:tetratricopeptide repeat protein [Photobacterium sanguinicancri]KXI23224.1 hypothetical protein AS132_08490 [Photobacterium sanguinicancri]
MSELNKMLSRLAEKQQTRGNQHAKHKQQAPLVAAKIRPVPSSKAPRAIFGTCCAVLLAGGIGWWFGQQPDTNVAQKSTSGDSFSPVMAANAAGLALEEPTTAIVVGSSLSPEATVPKMTTPVRRQNDEALLSSSSPSVPVENDRLASSEAVNKSNLPVPQTVAIPLVEQRQPEMTKALKIAAVSNPTATQSRAIAKRAPSVVQAPTVEDGALQEDASLSIEAVELTGPELAKIEYSRAMKAVKAGDSKKAVEFLTKAIQYHPDWIDARQRLSALHYGRGEVRQAILVLQRGLARDSEQPELRLTMAKLLVNESQPQAALTVLSDLPTDAPSKYIAMRGALAQQLKDNPRALESYQHLVKSEPFDGRWWLGLGIALERTNDAEKALHAYQQALVMGQISAQTQQFIQQRVSYLQSQGS